MNSNRKYVAFAVIVVVLTVAIFSILVIYFSRTNKDKAASLDSSTLISSAPALPEFDNNIVLYQPSETSVPIGSSGLEFIVPFPSPTGALALRDVALKRIQKLSPEIGQNTVKIRSCTKLGCFPAHPISLSPDEAIVAFDIVFSSHTATETDWVGQTAILDGRYARINADGKDYPIKELTYNVGNWIEQPPQINVSPLMTITQTVWARIPKTATNVEFQFASWKKIQHGPSEQHYTIVHDENMPIWHAPLGF